MRRAGATARTAARTTAPARAHELGAERATCERPACCARSSAHDMGTARSVHATWVLGVRTVHPTQFCDSALFRVTVHGHCS